MFMPLKFHTSLRISIYMKVKHLHSYFWVAVESIKWVWSFFVINPVLQSIFFEKYPESSSKEMFYFCFLLEQLFIFCLYLYNLSTSYCFCSWMLLKISSKGKILLRLLTVSTFSDRWEFIFFIHFQYVIT